MLKNPRKDDHGWKGNGKPFQHRILMPVLGSRSVLRVIKPRKALRIKPCWPVNVRHTNGQQDGVYLSVRSKDTG